MGVCSILRIVIYFFMFDFYGFLVALLCWDDYELVELELDPNSVEPSSSLAQK